MRQKHIDQVSIFDLFSNHEIGKELKAMSARLDQHRDILDWVARDLHLRDVADTAARVYLLNRYCVVHCSSNTGN